MLKQIQSFCVEANWTLLKTGTESVEHTIGLGETLHGQKSLWAKPAATCLTLKKRIIWTAQQSVATFRLEYKDNYQCKFYVLSTCTSKIFALQTKSMCPEQKTCTHSCPHTSIWRLLVGTLRSKIELVREIGENVEWKILIVIQRTYKILAKSVAASAARFMIFQPMMSLFYGVAVAVFVS